MKTRWVCLAVVLACLLAPAVSGAAEELPPFWLALSVNGATLDAGPQARPPTAENLPNPMAVVAPGGKVQLRGKVVGGRRAYMMWPETYANVGPNTTINDRGFDHMSFTVDTGTFRGSGEWSVTEEKYTWNTGGRGVTNVLQQYATGEAIEWTAPTEEGYYPITVQGTVAFKYVRQAPGGRSESVDNGSASMTFNVQVKAGAPGGTPTTPTNPTTPANPTTPTTPPQPEANYQQALQTVLQRFRGLGTGPVNATLPTYVVSAGFLNNVYSVFTNTNAAYTCGAWQGKVLDMFFKMQYGTPEERALFDQFDYGPIQAYYGGHQAVVIYPKGTDWQQTGTVLDPWPNQEPESFSIAAWKSRFWFGVGTSGVWAGQYPLTGGSEYPRPSLRPKPEHVPVLQRLTREQRQEYLNSTSAAEQDAFINALPAEVKQSTAVSVHSPVGMMVTDSMGRRVGWESPTSFLYEIPGVDVDSFPEPDGSKGLLLLLPKADYQVTLRADAAGSFTLTRALPGVPTPLTDVQNVPVTAGEAFFLQLSAGSPAAPLIKSNGTMLELGNVYDHGAPTTPSTPTTPTTPTSGDAPVITSPLPGGAVPPRAEVYGTGPPGAMIVVYTEVRAVGDDHLLKNVPGLRHKIEDDGTWHVAVPIPVLPENVAEPLYYVIKAYWVTQTHRSSEASVRVVRAQ